MAVDIAALGLKLETKDLEKGIQTLDRAGDSAKKTADKFDAASKNTTESNKVQGKSFEQLSGVVQGSAAAYLSLAAVVGTAISVGRQAIANAEEAIQVQKRLAAVYRATGGTVGYTTDELNKMADAMAATTSFDDESIRNGMAELIKFGNIHGKVFTDALKVAADYAAFTGGEFSTAAAEMGRALADADSASRLLRTMGVAPLTESQQALIKELQAAGREAEAQQIILDKLKGSFEGIDAEMNTGLTGSVKALRKSWDELLESVGKTKTVTEGTNSLAEYLRAVKLVIEDGDWFEKLRFFTIGNLSERLTTKLRAPTVVETKQTNTAAIAREAEAAKARASEALAEKSYNEWIAIEKEKAKKAKESATKLYEFRQQLAQETAKDNADLLKSAQDLTAVEETKAQAMQRTLDAYTSLTPAVRQYVQGQIDAAKALEDETHWRDVMNDSLDREIDLLNEVADAQRAQQEETARAIGQYADEMRRSQEDLNIEMLGSDRERVLAQIALEKERKIDYLRSLDDQTEATHAAIEAMIADTEQYYGSKVAKVNLEEQRDVWKSIESTAHDTFISIFDGGKSTAKRLKDAFKNTFYDWLYSMTLKKWIVNIGASFTGAAASGSALAAGESGGLPGLMSGGNSMFDVFTKGFDSMNDTFISSISGLGTKLIDFGFDNLGNAIANNAGMIADIAPFAGAAFSLFTQGAKGIPSAGLSLAGSLLGGPVGGILGGLAGSMLGGLFGGNKVPHPAASASAQLDNGKFSIVNANAKHLSKDSLDPFLLSSLTAYSDFVKSLGGKETKPLYLASSYDQKANNMRIGAVNPFSANPDDATAVSNAVKAAILDGIKSGTTDLPKYLKAMLDAATITTENASALMQAMAGFKQLRDSLAGMPVVFAKIATAIDSGFIPSMESAQALIQSTSTYYDAYYSEAERLALAQQGIASQFAALNVTLPTSKEGFRALVEGIDTSTAAGIGLYSALMQIAPGFAQVQDAAIATAAAAAQAQADLMQQRQGWQEQLDVLTGARTQTQIDRTNQLASTTDDATKALMQQVFAQQDAASAAAAQKLAEEQAAAAAQQAAQAQVDAAQRITDAWQGIADSVLGEVTRLRDKIMGSSPNSLAGAQSAFAIATAQARAGDQTAANSLPALSSKLDDLYAVTSASSADYRLALARQAASLLTTVDAMKQYGINVPGFASGGDFAGGWRVVGERGRELEATGPARIFNASQTANILGGSADISQLRSDIQAMTAKLEIMVGKMREIEKNTFDTAKATNGRADAPVLVKVTT